MKSWVLSTSDAQQSKIEDLQSYEKILAYLVKNPGLEGLAPSLSPLVSAFLNQVPRFLELLGSFSAGAAAYPDSSLEEWNPLSQRPHAPLNPKISSDEFGAEIISLKEALDSLTTLGHEMMHVFLWEPFFVGRWAPKSQNEFCNFSLLAEGFCYFYSDIIIAQYIRYRFPDAELAFQRQSPGNAFFHPSRAFAAINLTEPYKILEIYLDGFSGEHTPLWQNREGNTFAKALAKQAYDFYSGSPRYVNKLYQTLSKIGIFKEYYQRFCKIPNLPDLAFERGSPLDYSMKEYFMKFFENELKAQESTNSQRAAQVRKRRALQMRAYYAFQVRWLLSENLLIGNKIPSTRRKELIEFVNQYLNSIEQCLHQFGSNNRDLIPNQSKIDRDYEQNIRKTFIQFEVWVGQRWLIAPKRAAGLISIKPNQSISRKKLLLTVNYLIAELEKNLNSSISAQTSREVLKELNFLSKIALDSLNASNSRLKELDLRLQKRISKGILCELWSVPAKSFNPLKNEFRELIFSYQ